MESEMWINRVKANEFIYERRELKVQNSVICMVVLRITWSLKEEIL